jgi:serine phosphatase RsbU (regulator of sigma subunit)
MLALVDEAQSQPGDCWKLLVVDDEPEIHSVTRMVLSGLQLGGRFLQFLNAHSAAQARELLAQHPDIAVVLVDVVMETEDAGLRLVRYIRDELANRRVRLILRTGQAGQAPERQVVLDYDINDYKEKTELTAQKLATAVIAALRAYQALVELDELNAQLEAKVAQRTVELQLSNTRLRHSLAALEQGERAGRRVQFKLLPPARWSRHGYHFSHILLPSEFMSGDFVDYFMIDPQHIGFYIADVSGHGVASAFVTVYLKRFLSTALDAIQHGLASALLDPAVLLGQLNGELLRENMGKHIAIFYAVLEIQTGQLRYANAGAFPYPLLLEGSQVRSVVAPSRPAGLFEQCSYRNQSLQLSAGASLLLCSDGVLEILPQGSSQQRLAALEAAVCSGLSSLEELSARLQFREITPLPDDLTLLLVQCEAN